MKKTSKQIEERLEELRQEIRNENISYGEIAELQSLSKHIDKNDVELLQWAQPEAYSKGGKIEKEIAEYEALIADPSVPADEKEFAREEIAALKKSMENKKPAPKRRGRKTNREKTLENIEKNPPTYKKQSSYNCDDLIKQARERKANAQKRANAPKKTVATQIKQSIEKVEKKVENKYDKMSRADIVKLIAETRSLLKQLESALKKH